MTSSTLLCGVTGVVGRALLDQLLADDHFDPVLALARRPLKPGGRSARLRLCTVDFDNLDALADLFRVQQIFWALGSTIKQAGSQERFRAIDYGYAEKVARLGRAAGVQHFLLVSALGAAATSRVFYNRVKGEVEDMIKAMGFRSVTIVRPSILLGPRPEFRLGEAIAKRLFMVAPLKYRAVDVRDVAAVLIEAAKRDAPGVAVIESAQIPRAAR
jgi:uncharacterized protein YbjT (DUF2867 family)